MSVKLNERAFEHAKALVKDGKFVADERDDWSEDQPSTDEENEYLDKQGWKDYGLWYLGVDDEMGDDTKGHYKFPYGDFGKVHRCGLLAAESRAAQQGYDDIDRAVAHLHGMIDRG
ncbi:hypothetical protein ACGFIF_27830 [Kribbella sp. NPDC049174]|uniref:hypothetical protein n=1 Tax=Kribbella sp. NPDC049174 TaxID=3364112 RepID=UPI00370FED9D